MGEKRREQQEGERVSRRLKAQQEKRFFFLLHFPLKLSSLKTISLSSTTTTTTTSLLHKRHHGLGQLPRLLQVRAVPALAHQNKLGFSPR